MDNDIARSYFQGDHEMDYKTIPEVLYDISISLNRIAETLDSINDRLVDLKDAR